MQPCREVACKLQRASGKEHSEDRSHGARCMRVCPTEWPVMQVSFSWQTNDTGRMPGGSTHVYKDLKRAVLDRSVSNGMLLGGEMSAPTWMQAVMQFSLLWLFRLGSCTSGAPRRTCTVKRRMPCSLGFAAARLCSGMTTMVGRPTVMLGFW